MRSAAADPLLESRSLAIISLGLATYIELFHLMNRRPSSNDYNDCHSAYASASTISKVTADAHITNISKGTLETSTITTSDFTSPVSKNSQSTGPIYSDVPLDSDARAVPQSIDLLSNSLILLLACVRSTQSQLGHLAVIQLRMLAEMAGLLVKVTPQLPLLVLQASFIPTFIQP
ncbi:unnamed protein product [Protopolystoma xenopodis]|uniref:Uncharacterized protein n=1 Tax=Protopolystoma xenopodis TaxID=117903 RepID=A0A3S5AN51_9PLAT|nr:unnamed protein product [Protopolystoma xenopodis]